MDAVLLARIQFAVTVGFHFIFPPITIGLAWLIFIFELLGFRKKEEVYVKLGKFFGKLLAITFAVGVATGIVMEFQFGTNWSQYSKFVGDIFGAPLAAEAIFAFFLESGFIGLYLFGRNRVSKGIHLFAALMVALGSTISAFWILVANSWQQTPAGFIIQNGRAELIDFWAAIFNPSTFVRFSHTFLATLITGAFFVAGVSAYLILKKKEVETMKKALKIAVIFGAIVSLLELMPSGHHHAVQVAKTQPAKFAAIEGIYQGRTNAPLIAFGIPADNPPRLLMPIEIPGLVSYMVYGDVNAYVQGFNDFPPGDTPPVFLTFVSFHSMVALGSYFILITLIGVFLLWKKKLYDTKLFLKAAIWSIPLPVIACQLGWIAAEVGRQPWIVYGYLRTRDAISISVPAEQILISLVLFSAIYVLLGALYLYILIKEIKHGPEPVNAKEVGA